MTWTILANINLACALLSYYFLAYALAQLQWRGRGIFLVLLAIIICGQVWLIPQAVSTCKFGSNILLYGIWFANWLVTAFSIVLLSNSLRATSRDMSDAARIDGCGALRIYWHIILPLVRPTLFLLAFLTFMATWSAFLAPLFPRFADAFLISVSAHRIADLRILLTVSVFMTLPLIAIFFFAHRYLLKA